MLISVVKEQQFFYVLLFYYFFNLDILKPPKYVELFMCNILKNSITFFSNNDRKCDIKHKQVFPLLLFQLLMSDK